MDLKQAEAILEKYNEGQTVYEQEYIDALGVVNAHLEKQVSHWKFEALKARKASESLEV